MPGQRTPALRTRTNGRTPTCHARYGRARSTSPTTERAILQVSTSAVSILEEARAAQDVPESFGVRLFTNADDNGQGVLALAFTDQPASGDEVTEQDGTEIYVAPELAGPLADQRLDVQDTPTGPQLMLVPQDPGQ